MITYHKDNARTGLYSDETTLTTANVRSATFGLKRMFTVDGKVDAQPLYLSNVSVSGQLRNVLYIVTEHASAYAFDADTGAQIWKTSALLTGESPSDALGCDQVIPEIGITSTPVIDRTRGPNGAIYLVAMSKNNSGTYFQRIHALDLASGAELFGGPQPITASVSGSGAGGNGTTVPFDPKQYEERAGLLMLNGVLYTAWTSHCDFDPYTGWVIGINPATLQRSSVINITPNGSRGAIWMAGGGLAADSSGAIYFLSGNGDFGETLDSSGFPTNRNFGNGFIKLSTAGGTLSVADYFATSNTNDQSNADTDLGSGGVLLVPDVVDSGGTTRRLAVGAGKDANIYVVNRDSMGKFRSGGPYQTLSGSLAGAVFSKPAFFNGKLYYGAVGDRIKAFAITNALFSSAASSQTSNTFGYPGATPSISSNGSANGIVWAVENGGTAVLHAYDANNLATELYNSNQAANNRDHFGAGNKFIAPVIARGRVYVGTPNGVAAFGLLP